MKNRKIERTCSQHRDDIVEEVRKSREKTAKRESADPDKFFRENRKIAKRLGIGKSNLKPLKMDFSILRRKKAIGNQAA